MGKKAPKRKRTEAITYYQNLLLNPNIKALLSTITRGEGTLGNRGYYKHFGKGYIDKLDAIPPHKIYEGSGKAPDTGNDTVYLSSAVTAFQFLNLDREPYLEDQTSYFGYKDVLPVHQEMYALHRMDNDSTISNILDGNIISVFRQIKYIWASKPYSNYGQQTQKLLDALLFYQKKVGILDSNNQLIVKNLAARKPLTKTINKPKGRNVSGKSTGHLQINTLDNYPEWMNTNQEAIQIDNRKATPSGGHSLRSKYKKPVDTLKPPSAISTDSLMKNIFRTLPNIENKGVKPEKIDQKKLSTYTYPPSAHNSWRTMMTEKKAGSTSFLEVPDKTGLLANGGALLGLPLSHNRSFFRQQIGRESVNAPDRLAITKRDNTDSQNENAATVVNVNLNAPMIDNFTIHTTDINSAVGDIKRQVEEVLLDVLNSVNTIQ